MKQNTFNKWLNQTERECWSEKDIIYFRKAINSSAISPEQHDLLMDAVEGKSYALHPEQQDKGTRYLLSKSLKLNGTPRKHNKLSPECISILRNDPVHRLVGFRNLNPYGMNSYVAVYEAKDSFGRCFRYTGVTYDLLDVLYVYAPEPKLHLVKVSND